MTNQQIHDEIMEHVKKEGSSYKNWRVGIAADAEGRLLDDHNVPRNNAWWIYREAASADDSRQIEKFLIENYGFDGGPGGGDHSTKYVYAYRKTPTTNP